MRHIAIEKEEEKIWVVTIDSSDSSVNALSTAMFDEVEGLVEELEASPTAQGLVIRSGKPKTFVAGADLDELRQMDTADEAAAYIRRANALLARLEAWPKPVVCAIHGACLGGGLELALACDARVASDAPETLFALPEVKLGLFPAGGGTQRLPRLIGLTEALPLLLMGTQLRVKKAARLGLIDEVVHPYVLKEAAVAWVKRLAKGGAEKRRPRRSFLQRGMEAVKPGRDLMLYMARKGVMKQTKGVYPAPLAIIDSVTYGCEHGVARGLEADSRRFSELLLSPESRGLTRLFYAMKRAGRKRATGSPRSVRKMAVLGAGLMGNGVAGVSVGMVETLLLKDLSLDSAAKGVQAIRDGLAIRARSGGITPFEKESLGAKVVACDDFSAFRGTDLVVEAVFEDLELKRALLSEVEQAAGEAAIFATNTSSIPIAEIARGAKRPEQVVGMHYFSPVRSMPLLEIIATDQTADWVIDTAFDVGMRQGKTCIVVHDGPAFYTTRILTMMLNEALLLLEEGADVATLDDAMTRFGFPVGPMTLVDEVGFDVGVHVGEVMRPTAEKRGVPQAKALQRLFDKGFLGRKNGRGFYAYSGKRKGAKPMNGEVRAIVGGELRGKVSVEEVQQRVSLAMVNEAMICLEEKVIGSAEDGDLGAVLGLGFPPFTGGPFRYVDAQGPATILETLETLEKRFGRRFKPAEILRRKTLKGQGFYEEEKRDGV